MNHFAKTSTISLAAKPSPNGLGDLLILKYSFLSLNRSETLLKIVSISVPTNLTVPASTASGRSVLSLIAKTGLPKLGASY